MNPDAKDTKDYCALCVAKIRWANPKNLTLEDKRSLDKVRMIPFKTYAKDGSPRFGTSCGKCGQTLFYDETPNMDVIDTLTKTDLK